MCGGRTDQRAFPCFTGLSSRFGGIDPGPSGGHQISYPSGRSRSSNSPESQAGAPPDGESGFGLAGGMAWAYFVWTSPEGSRTPAREGVLRREWGIDPLSL